MILIVGALTFFPVLSLGPIVEHLLHVCRANFLSRKTDTVYRMNKEKTVSIWDPQIVTRAIGDHSESLIPITMMKNPVMFVVEVGSVITTILLIRDISNGAPGIGFGLQITLWLWFTVLFANFAEAMAEGRGKAQADNLRKSKN